MTKVIVAERKINCDHLVGQFLDESHYDTLIDYDCDAYGPAETGLSIKSDSKLDEKRILFKFRKNFFTKQQQDDA